MQTTTAKGMEEVMASGIFEVGTAGPKDSPCLMIHARHQNSRTQEQSASLLSTLWACDAAIGSQENGAARLTVGYDFKGAGAGNFSMGHALHFSRLFLNEYPCLVKDVYLISMPWVLRQLMPLFSPLVSRRVRLIGIDSPDDFVKSVGYEPIARSGKPFAAYVNNRNARAAALLNKAKEQRRPVSDDRSDAEPLALQPLQVLKPFFNAIGFASSYFSQLQGSTQNFPDWALVMQ
jgi:hypothetical protein